MEVAEAEEKEEKNEKKNNNKEEEDLAVVSGRGEREGVTL